MKSSLPAQRERLQAAVSGHATDSTAQRLGQPAGFSDQRPAMLAHIQRQQLADRSPQARQLQAFSAIMNRQPAPVLQRAEEELQGKFHTAQRREDDEPVQEKGPDETATPAPGMVATRNDTGLPNQLKAGVESLSGISLDAVKVHYNSAQPAQLNAHAYAQGTDIHIGPGQEKHLPHEAWHVVQQAQGRVRPTMQMKAGVAINDDSGLENEADVMGARAMDHGAQVVQQMLPGRAASGINSNTATSMIMAGSAADAPVQRDVYEHRAKPSKKVNQTKIENAKKIAKNVFNIVERVRPVALDWRQFNGSDGYLGNWYKMANKQYQLGSDGQVSLLHAAFGYAVETLACAQLNKVEFGLNVALQVTSVNTRPDIEITDDDDNIVSWQDITTKAEKNHTEKKSGSGWKTHPYVCEILYDSLERDEVFNGSDHPFYSKEGKTLTSKLKNRAEAEENVKIGMANVFTYLKNEDDDYTWSGGNQSEKQKEVKKLAREEFGNSFGGGKIDLTMRSTLKELGFNPGHFGYKGSGQSKSGFSSHVWESAQPEIEESNTKLFTNQFGQIGQSLHSYQHTPFLPGFQQGWQQTTNTREKEQEVRRGHMRQAVLEVYDQLRLAYNELYRMHGLPGRETMMNNMFRHVGDARFDGDIDFGVQWIDKAREMMRWLDLVKEDYEPQVKPGFGFDGHGGDGGSNGNNGGSLTQDMDFSDY